MNMPFGQQQPPAPAEPVPAQPATPAPVSTTTATPAPATPAGEAPRTAGWEQFLPFILIIAVFWFLLIKPQRKQQQERERLISNIRKSDHVITSGGLYGIVDRIKDNEVILKIDEKNDVRVRVAKSAIVGVEKVAGAEEDVKPSEPEADKK